ncbi:MAG: divalent-cation tolerance protein CutA [Mariprofundaceae bacterium]|nr:divalent-cation tolerance protein CutA [Mariprofundaceae bacterium]
MHQASGKPIGIILTSVDDASMAKSLARGLIAAHLAACVQISPAGTSIYRWTEDDSSGDSKSDQQREIQEASEYYLSIKAPMHRINEIISWLQRQHPYDTPEIVILEAQAASAYAEWVQQVAGTSNP